MYLLIVLNGALKVAQHRPGAGAVKVRLIEIEKGIN